jgi:hypothetical protein
MNIASTKLFILSLREKVSKQTSTPPGNRTLPVGFGNQLASLGTLVRVQPIFNKPSANDAVQSF